MGIVAHGCNPRYLEGKDWEDHSLRLAMQKVSKIPFQQKIWKWWHTPTSQLQGRCKVGES
jgi:hypothetical protein